MCSDRIVRSRKPCLFRVTFGVCICKRSFERFPEVLDVVRTALPFESVKRSGEVIEHRDPRKLGRRLGVHAKGGSETCSDFGAALIFDSLVEQTEKREGVYVDQLARIELRNPHAQAFVHVLHDFNKLRPPMAIGGDLSCKLAIEACPTEEFFMLHGNLLGTISGAPILSQP